MKPNQMYHRAAFASWLIVVVAVLAGAATTAQAGIVGAPVFQRWANQSQAPLPPLEVRARFGSPEDIVTLCGEVQQPESDGRAAPPLQIGGCAWPEREPPEVAVAVGCMESLDEARELGWPAGSCPRFDARRNFYHELGHVFDERVLSNTGRAAFLALLGAPGAPWLAGNETGGFAAAEDFADAYAQCGYGLRWREWIKRRGEWFWSPLPELRDGKVTAHQMNRMCRLIMRSWAG